MTISTRNVLAGLGLALLIWFGGMAGLALLVEPTAVIVFGPSAVTIKAIDRTDASILSFGQGFVVARAPQAGFVRQLYGAGAWFVWPSLPRFCGSLGTPATQRVTPVWHPAKGNDNLQ
jgi:hypothetical protein